MGLSYAQLVAYIDGLYANNELSEQDYNNIIVYILANGDIENAPRDLIQIRRGDLANLPVLAQGELAITLDTEELFIGGINGNVKLATDTDIINIINNVETVTDDLSDFKQDYEYQTPNVVGTQIQLIKLSDSSIIKFKLDAEIIGGDITISIDEGVTDLPLQDIEGLAIAELEKGFVEVIADATFFTLRPRGGLSSTDITTILGSDGFYYQGVFITYDALENEINESLVYGGTIQTIAVQGEFVYYAGAGTRTVIKAKISDLNTVATSPVSNSNVNGITIEGDFVYYCGSDNKIFKANVSNLATVAESSNYGTILNTVASQGDFVYYAGTGGTVKKANVSDLVEVETSSNYGNSIETIDVDGDFVYYAGVGATATVRKANVSNLVVVETSPSYGGDIYSLAIKGDFVFYGGLSETLIKANVSDLATITTSPSYGGIIRTIAFKDDFVYYAGSVTSKVYQANISDLSKEAESPYYNSLINAMAISNNFVFYGGMTSQRVIKTDATIVSQINYYKQLEEGNTEFFIGFNGDIYQGVFSVFDEINKYANLLYYEEVV